MREENETLKHALTKMLEKNIAEVEFEAKRLHGGTLGDVQLLEGMAEGEDGTQIPFKIVRKSQKKWERPGDPASWRREYDLYRSGLGGTFMPGLRWPQCYHTQINPEGNEIQLWMEYIEGVSGLSLTGEMYERAARELGRFQGRLYASKPEAVYNLTNLSQIEYSKQFYWLYRSWQTIYDYVRSEECGIPRHLRQMLIDADENADAIWQRIERLPVVLCHRDFWVTNVFYTPEEIILIDWDTTGWGYLGEDLASLLADEADVEHMVEYYQRCLPAYYQGFSEYVDLSHIEDPCVYELILMLFGYRLAEWHMNAKEPDEKRQHLDTLERLYAIGKL